MSNHKHQADEIDYILRDALRSNRDAALNADRGFAALRARITAERWPTRIAWSSCSPSWSGSYMPASYWYLAPLMGDALASERARSDLEHS